MEAIPMFGVARGSLAVLALIAVAGCSSAPSGGNTGGATSPTKPAAGNGTATGTGTPSGGTASTGSQAVTDTGTIVDYNSKAPVQGATVTAGDQTVTTGADGTFSLTLQKGEAFQLSVVADGYATLLQQQTALEADYAAGSLTIVPQSLASLLTAMLPGYDDTLGVLSVDLVATGACTSEAGATLTVTPAGSAQVAYFSGGLPSNTQLSVKAGEFPSAVVYNVQPGVQLAIAVTQASCKEVPFPYTTGGVEYTGGITTQPGLVTGFARIFLN
jgi:hypothetical protein